MKESELGNGGMYWYPDEGIDSVLDLGEQTLSGYPKSRTYIGVRKLLPMTHRTYPQLASAFDSIVNDGEAVVNYTSLKEATFGKSKQQCLTIGVLYPSEHRAHMRTLAVDIVEKFNTRVKLGEFSTRSSLRCTFIGDDSLTGTIDQWHIKFTGKVNAQDKNFKALARLLQQSFYSLEDKLHP